MIFADRSNSSGLAEKAVKEARMPPIQILLLSRTLTLALCTMIAFALPGTFMKIDQANDTRWQNGWTNLLNDVEQSFRPSMPRLLGVEVELVIGNP